MNPMSTIIGHRFHHPYLHILTTLEKSSQCRESNINHDVIYMNICFLRSRVTVSILIATVNRVSNISSIIHNVQKKI